jgi:predicted XRE-type DNA-binding protein
VQFILIALKGPAQLARQINALIKERGLKQLAASELLGITQPEISQITNSHFIQFYI